MIRSLVLVAVTAPALAALLLTACQAPATGPADAGPAGPEQAQKIGHIDPKDRPQDGGCDVWAFKGELFSICSVNGGDASAKAKAKQ